MRYFLGADIGSSKTHVLIADEAGQAAGFGQSGPGNHEMVGYDGLQKAVRQATQQALAMARISKDQIAGAGFGVAGYDWPSEKEPTLRALARLGLAAPVEAVNDAVLGLLAGSPEGWGLAVVSGTGCNCWGRDRTHTCYGQVTGGSDSMGEGAGGGELVRKVIQLIAYEWTRRGPATELTPAMVRHFGARDVVDLLQGVSEGRINPHASAAPLIFQLAAQGDAVARNVIQWAGHELGELAKAVIRQLGFEALEFDVVLVGSLFNGGSRLIEPMEANIHSLAPGARLVRLEAPPVVGAVLLGMEQANINTAPVRATLMTSAKPLTSSEKN
jgi:N-acetylglucosamine kinase-like BadF-type ATPase